MLGGQSEVSYRAHLTWFGGIFLRGGTMNALPDTDLQRKSVRWADSIVSPCPPAEVSLIFYARWAIWGCCIVPTCRSFMEFLCQEGSLRCHIVPTWHGLVEFSCEVVQCIHYLTQNGSESQSGGLAALPCPAHQNYIRYPLMSCPVARPSLISVEEMSTAGASVIRSILLPGHSFSSRAFAADMSWPLRG